MWQFHYFPLLSFFLPFLSADAARIYRASGWVPHPLHHHGGSRGNLSTLFPGSKGEKREPGNEVVNLVTGLPGQRPDYSQINNNSRLGEVIFLPEFRKFNNFRIFRKLFQEISIPFAPIRKFWNFSLNSNQRSCSPRTKKCLTPNSYARFLFSQIFH